MSIDWLQDLEREITRGEMFFASPSMGRSNWSISKSLEALEGIAQRVADHKKIDVTILRLMHADDALPGSLFLVPTTISEQGPSGEPNIKWATVETKKAAFDLRELRYGPAPFFSTTEEKAIAPSE